MSDVEHTAPQLQPASQGQVVVQADGTLVYTHGHRYPDNRLRVMQTHRADGSLQSAHIVWDGFAGPLLDITASFDAAGKLRQEVGYRASSVKDSVSRFIQPLPSGHGAALPGTETGTASPLGELSRASVFGQAADKVGPDADHSRTS